MKSHRDALQSAFTTPSQPAVLPADRTLRQLVVEWLEVNIGENPPAELIDAVVRSCENDVWQWIDDCHKYATTPK